MEKGAQEGALFCVNHFTTSSGKNDATFRNV